MFELFIPLSCVLFLFSIISGPHRRYSAILAWTTIIIVFLGGIPDWKEESNFLYPIGALLSIPFLWVTIRLLIKETPVVYQLTSGAGVAFLIYAPFAFYEPAGNALISLVVAQTNFVMNLLGYYADIVLWNTFQRGIYKVEIILACTGIQAIAIMLGVAAAVRTTNKEKLIAVLLIVPSIYILNLIRNAGVIIAYTDQWFASLPDITGNIEIGYSSFFWAHNVVAEGLALLFMIILAYSLFTYIPALGDFAVTLVETYEKEIKSISGKDT